ncbi:hypothetical protein [Bifidobacterium thermophilum]|uniref:hypothetical protein n=1 Tax=Bifidobacterium thermophilum TaxID=33905 RepID=UPI0030A886A2
MTTECRGGPRLDSGWDHDAPTADATDASGTAAVQARQDALTTTIVQAKTHGTPMRAGRIMVLYELRAPGISGTGLMCENATVICDGDVEASRISGSGRLLVRGNIRCDTLDFTGEIRCTGRIVCTDGLTATGLLHTQSGIDAAWIDMTGVVDAPHIFADHEVSVRGIGNGLGVQRAFPHSTRLSEVGLIDAGTVTVGRMVCDRIEAERITLTDACRVRVVPHAAVLSHDIRSRVAFSAMSDGSLAVNKHVPHETAAASRRTVVYRPARA